MICVQQPYATFEAGVCYINIQTSILDSGFPQKKSFTLRSDSVTERTDRSASSFKGAVVLSFTPAQNFLRAGMQTIERDNKLGMKVLKETQKELLKKHRKMENRNTALGSIALFELMGCNIACFSS